MTLYIQYSRVLSLVVLKGFVVFRKNGSNFYYVEILESNYYRYEARTVLDLVRNIKTTVVN